MCIKLVPINELYYDARPNKSQVLHLVGWFIWKVSKCTNLPSNSSALLSYYTTVQRRYLVQNVTGNSAIVCRKHCWYFNLQYWIPTDTEGSKSLQFKAVEPEKQWRVVYVMGQWVGYETEAFYISVKQFALWRQNSACRARGLTLRRLMSYIYIYIYIYIWSTHSWCF